MSDEKRITIGGQSIVLKRDPDLTLDQSEKILWTMMRVAAENEGVPETVFNQKIGEAITPLRKKFVYMNSIKVEKNEILCESMDEFLKTFDVLPFMTKAKIRECVDRFIAAGMMQIKTLSHGVVKVGMPEEFLTDEAGSEMLRLCQRDGVLPSKDVFRLS